MTARQTSKLWNIALGMAVLSLLVAFYVAYRQYDLVNCLADRDAQVRTRTNAIAAATDAERIADLALLRDDNPDTRAAAIAARGATDKVRAQNPAPSVERC